MGNVCIFCVLMTFLEMCLDLKNFLKWELLILHMFYSGFCAIPRGHKEFAADLRGGGGSPWEGVGGG